MMEKQKYLYAYAAYAQNGNEFKLMASSLLSPDDLEAETAAMSACLLLFPLDQGWSYHKVSVTPIPTEWHTVKPDI